MNKKDKFGMFESLGAGLAVAGYSLSPLPNIIGGTFEGLARAYDISDRTLDTITGISETKDNHENNNTRQEEVKTSLEKKAQQQAYTPTKTEKAKQLLDDTQRELSVKHTGVEIVDKPIDYRSRVMQTTKGWIGKLVGSEKIQKDAEYQGCQQYADNYNANEGLQSAAYKRIDELNSELKQEQNAGTRNVIVEKKKDVYEFAKTSQGLNTEQIHAGKENETYAEVQARAHELGLEAPSYQAYDITGMVIGGIVAAYLGAKAGRTLDKVVNTVSPVVKFTGKGIGRGFNLVGNYLNRKRQVKPSDLSNKIQPNNDDLQSVSYSVGMNIEGVIEE
jgi:hypothetical protein